MHNSMATDAPYVLDYINKETVATSTLSRAYTDRRGTFIHEPRPFVCSIY